MRKIVMKLADSNITYAKLYSLFVQTPLMQFSPSLMFVDRDCVDSIIYPLLATKYFTRTLQRCTVHSSLSDNLPFLEALSKVQSLTTLDLRGLGEMSFEFIINSFPSTVETLSIDSADLRGNVKKKRKAKISSPAAKSLRNLTLKNADALFVAQIVLNFSNLRKMVLSDQKSPRGVRSLDLRLLSTSLPLLTDLSLAYFSIKNSESLKNLVHLSSLELIQCSVPDLNFLTPDNSLPHLTTLFINTCTGPLKFTSSFASLAHAKNLHGLMLASSGTKTGVKFNNDCFQYIENMIHLRKLDLSNSKIVGDSRLFKTLMQNLFQLEELNLKESRGVGNQGAIAGALYSTHSRLRVLNLRGCDLVDDDLNGIGALQNTLEVFEVAWNWDLTSEGLTHCGDLVKLKILNLQGCGKITDLPPLKDCLNLEELDVAYCHRLDDDSFEVFSEEPNSFPNLRRLHLVDCENLTEAVLEHLSKNNNLVYQLKELNVEGIRRVSSSSTARNNICQLQGLRRLRGIASESESDENKLKSELMQRLRNLEEISQY